MNKLFLASLLSVGAFALAAPLWAQQAAAPASDHEAATSGPTITPQAVPNGYAAFPADPALVQAGKALFTGTLGCANCHAADTRGTDRGPNLRRSTYVLDDKGNGGLVGFQVREAAGHNGAFANLSDADAKSLAHFMKSLQAGPAPEIGTPAKFTLGNQAAGETYFKAKCASCHAVTAGASGSSVNLAGIGTRVADGKTLQQTWLSPNTSKVTTAVVTMKDGTTVQGPATAINEFTITLTVNGAPRTIEQKDTKKIDMTYPLAGHSALLHTITDNNIHDVTAYLASLK
ncbi:MAG: cytochrome c, class [Caulobacteraceae bacterium]|nr:cytochrome c, class [Caulobacteraceae bacterium]